MNGSTLSSVCRLCARPSVVALLLAAATVAVYWPITGHEFVYFDDDLYVTRNPAVQQGVTPAGLVWAVTAFHAANWHPLTWLSHMVDWQLWGENAGGHHASSLVLHVANALLLFVLLLRTTAAVGRSAFVVALFALHPLHVESVAWVAERKDVLSTLFWFLALLAWVGWTRRPTLPRYALVALAMAASLAAKPMAVTLPLTLLLLDLWPLRRAEAGGIARWRALVVEKLPLFALSAASSAVTLLAQNAGGAVRTLDDYSLPVRAANAAVAYLDYLMKAVWPSGLAVLYPHPGVAISTWKAFGASFLLAGVTVVVLQYRRRAPWLACGWLWYVVTLVPVIGLVQVGAQAMADRYTYVPLIGPAIVVAWGVPSLLPSGRGKTWLLPLAALMVVAVCCVAARVQVGYWENTETLLRRATAVTDDNKVAHYNLAGWLREQGRLEEAEAHYREALRMRPDADDAGFNLGQLLVDARRFDEAARTFRELLRHHPDWPAPMLRLATILSGGDSPEQGAEAIRLAERAVELDRGDDPAALEILAVAHFNQALRVAPAEALEHYRDALAIAPDYLDARWNLANLLFRLGRLDEAAQEYRELLRTDPDAVEPLTKLASILVTHPDPAARDPAEALRLAGRAAERTGGRDPLVLYVLATAHRAAGERDGTIRAACAASRLVGPDHPLRSQLVELIGGADCR